jgi:hypothetical protein
VNHLLVHRGGSDVNHLLVHRGGSNVNHLHVDIEVEVMCITSSFIEVGVM